MCEHIREVVVMILIPSFSLFCYALLFFVNRPLDIETTSVPAKMPANDNPLTSHVLNTATGRPAQGVRVNLSKQVANGNWQHVSEKFTNQDGRVGNLIPAEEFVRGTYKLHFDTRSYFDTRQEKTFYPYIDVVFEIERPEEHFHVPILLSAYGYSTYRGS